ncbi:hypothetical protein ACNQFN_18670 [Thauera butanivorans]|uniref:hypothetical protein n=1 Tax=Thauera butanivorans TaxID=86174 RepID=UPI003AB65DF5
MIAETDDVFVTFEHMHNIPGWGARPGFCHRGARTWCAQYGLDWESIVRAGGIPASMLIATGDAMAAALVDYARSQECGNG